MKHYLLMLVLLLSVSGCSIINLPIYSESEYNQLIDIAVLSAESTCQPAEVAQLNKLSNRAALHSAYLPHNGRIAHGVTEMDKTIESLKQAAPNSTFCELKLRSITSMATTLADAAGSKTR